MTDPIKGMSHSRVWVDELQDPPLLKRRVDCSQAEFTTAPGYMFASPNYNQMEMRVHGEFGRWLLPMGRSIGKSTDIFTRLRKPMRWIPAKVLCPTWRSRFSKILLGS